MCEDVGYVGGAVLPLICSWGFKTKGNRGLQNYENSPMPETLSQHCQMLVLDEEGGFQRTHSSVLEGDQHPPPPRYLFGMPERIANNLCDVGKATVSKVPRAVPFPPSPCPSHQGLGFQQGPEGRWLLYCLIASCNI